MRTRVNERESNQLSTTHLSWGGLKRVYYEKKEDFGLALFIFGAPDITPRSELLIIFSIHIPKKLQLHNQARFVQCLLYGGIVVRRSLCK